MLNKLMKAYAAFMMTGDTGLLIHLVGPPGSGKSSVVEQLALLTGTKIHKISVPRISPLEVEGLQMPITDDDEHRLELLLATHWNDLAEGDIVFFDEFLAGFPEVYASLLDIFTSREVGKRKLPRVFMVAASNAAAAPTPAMEDRMLHIPVKDPRKLKSERQFISQLLIKECGLLPEVEATTEMHDLLEKVVLPTFDVMDHILGKKAKSTDKVERHGKSLRNLIGQVKLRMVQTPELKDLIDTNNSMSMSAGKPQYVVLLGAAPKGYEQRAIGLKDNPRLTPIQQINIMLNLQLIELGRARFEEGEMS